MKVFTVLSSVAAVVVALSSTADAQRLLRSEASAQTDSTVTTTDFTTLGSMGGSSFTPGNVAAGSSFGALDKEGGSMNDHRPSGSMRGGFGSGNGMHNVGSGDGFAHGSGSFGGGRGGFGGHGHHGMGGGSFSGSSFAGSFSGHGGFGAPDSAVATSAGARSAATRRPSARVKPRRRARAKAMLRLLLLPARWLRPGRRDLKTAHQVTKVLNVASKKMCFMLERKSSDVVSV